MFKILFINKLLFLFIFIITLFSCDGRNRKHKSNAEVLHEKNLFNSFSEQIIFSPEHNVEIVNDTILKNGFHIKMKYYSVKNNSIIKIKKTENDTTTKILYKNFIAKLKVSKNGKVIYDSVIDKSLFSTHENSMFLKNSIMQYIWVDYEASTKKELYLNTSFNIPETENYKDFVIKIDEDGGIKIKEKNISENII